MSSQGTAALSKITGRLQGVSKKVKAVVVRIPTVSEIGRVRPTWGEVCLVALQSVLEDLIRKRNSGEYDPHRTAIVYMSFGVEADPGDWGDGMDQGLHVQYKKVLDSLIENGALPITGSGDRGDVRTVRETRSR
jgi:hypothetical protein